MRLACYAALALLSISPDIDSTAVGPPDSVAVPDTMVATPAPKTPLSPQPSARPVAHLFPHAILFLAALCSIFVLARDD
jgi:hypothetical protein